MSLHIVMHLKTNLSIENPVKFLLFYKIGSKFTIFIVRFYYYVHYIMIINIIMHT